MKLKSSVVAQKLLNLYRQAHVIIGGWGAVNKVFVKEADDDVIDELLKLPNGTMLAAHINNLKSKKTPMDGIERELLPYGGAFVINTFDTRIADKDMNELIRALEQFTPDADGLARIRQLEIVRRFGNEWETGILRELANRPDLAEQWAIVMRTSRAYELWNTASWIMSEPISERTRARIQADLPEYETYLPMFGDAGDELLGQLRALVSATK